MKKALVITAFILLAGGALILSVGCDIEVESTYLEAIQQQIADDKEAAGEGAPTFSAIYNGNGHTGGLVPEDTNAYEEGAEVTVLGNTNGLEKTGYSFVSWNTKKDGSGTVFNGNDTFTIGSEDVTLYAQWTDLATYTVTYYGNESDGGTVPVDENNYLPGSIVTVLEPGTLSKTEHTFSGWNTQEGGGGTPRTPDDTFAIGNANVELHAQWTINTYTVTLDEQGGTPSGQTITVIKDQPYGTLHGVTYTDHFFEGWWTSPHGLGIEVTSGTIVTTSADHTLYASWDYDGWTRLSGSVSTTVEGFDIAVYAGGIGYVTGYTRGDLDGQTLTGTRDSFVIKYDSDGNKQWTRLSGVSGVNTRGYGIWVDSNGNSYTTGYTEGDLDGQTCTGTADAFIIKHDLNGTRQWTRLLGAAGTFTSGAGITVFSNFSSSAYVTGQTAGSLNGQTLQGNKDVFVVSFNGNTGDIWWTRQSGVAGKATIGSGIAVDQSRNSYVTGYTQGNLDGETLTGSRDVFVIKYDPDGNKQWTRLSGISGKDTEGKAIAVDPAGNCYVTGYTKGSLDGQAQTGSQDVFVIKYNSSGNKEWTRLSGVTFKYTSGEGVSVDSEGNCYVTGYTGGALDGQSLTGYNDAFVIKYDSNGVRQWTRLLGISDGTTWCYGISIDSNDICYIAGSTDGNLDGEALTGDRGIFVTSQLNF